ncbi:epidermal patterning factor-like protein [Striga asiatica]|uniref:Epidermal patterning factor-like protein n=1 Tax=Striga asiatica TaxID=4170 RepID=A0A5A7Q6F1_STRAF|nr:epidermal patterning factor-like protein [Striga asiatica]
MDRSQNLVHRHFTKFSLILLIFFFTLILHAQARKLPQTDPSFKTVEEEKTMWRVRIGSSPPRCERICESCRHCEAVQIPTTNPQVKARIQNSSSNDDTTNYKPLSWKCKCGNLIFNP